MAQRSRPPARGWNLLKPSVRTICAAATHSELNATMTVMEVSMKVAPASDRLGVSASLSSSSESAPSTTVPPPATGLPGVSARCVPSWKYRYAQYL
jgi:hypothetical protein